jgi:glycosyltransferase involved in cell wall biosynthesis
VSAAPRLSIGLLVYNGEKYLGEALESLLGQSYEDFELIISDNASTDGTARICHRYGKQDSRVRYIRQPRNIGAALNRNFLVCQARGELFMEAYHDDLWARDLLKLCIAALDDNPRAVLAHCWTAAIDDRGNVTQASRYPLSVDSPRAPERFRSMLFGTGGDGYGLIQAEEGSGVIRSDVLRRVAPLGSYYHADRIPVTELALHGPFHQVRDWLYFRRDHPDRAGHAPSVRSWCTNLDPRRADKLRHSLPRLYGEYIAGFIGAIRRAPLSPADRYACYRFLAAWGVSRAVHGGMLQPRERVSVPPPVITSAVVDAVVAGREPRAS